MSGVTIEGGVCGSVEAEVTPHRVIVRWGGDRDQRYAFARDYSLDRAGEARLAVATILRRLVAAGAQWAAGHWVGGHAVARKTGHSRYVYVRTEAGGAP